MFTLEEFAEACKEFAAQLRATRYSVGEFEAAVSVLGQAGYTLGEAE